MAQDLKPRLSESCRVTTDFFVRKNFSKDLARVPALMETALFRTTPFLVVQPQTEQDVTSVLAFCKSKRIAVFPRGSGSFAFGGAVPTQNGIVLDFSPMNSILKIDPEEKTVLVQPGARWADIAAKLEPFGFIPVTSPTSRFSTVAGWISTGGMGLDSYVYGSVYESVLGVRVVRPDGTVEKLGAQDESLKLLFGTEGQFGILTEILLRIRPQPKYSGVCLLTFDSPIQAFALIEELSRSDNNPSHVVFFDREYQKRENLLFSEHTPKNDPIVAERDSVLLHFENAELEQKFISSLNGKGNHLSENHTAARFLWADRFFPLKAQRLSPGLLGSEVVIPCDKVPKYITKVRKLAPHFRILPAIEVIVCRQQKSYTALVIVSFNCDYSKSIHYTLGLLFIQLLVKMAVHSGGHPYGIGIWNTPFAGSRYRQGRLHRLKEKKQKIDPKAILNPNKFFKTKGRFFSIPALFMHPLIFPAILNMAHFLTPALGIIARLFGPKPPQLWEIPAAEDEQGKTLLSQCAQRCTSCGACISVCPAYFLTRDELVAGRTKLRMAEAMMQGMKLKPPEALSPFQCLHCGLCEEVCQTHLPLRECYQVIEDWLEKRFGPPTEIVQKFLATLDQNRDFIKEVFGLDIPDWAPPPEHEHEYKSLTRVPAVDRLSEGKDT